MCHEADHVSFCLETTRILRAQSLNFTAKRLEIFETTHGVLARRDSGLSDLLERVWLHDSCSYFRLGRPLPWTAASLSCTLRRDRPVGR